MPMKFPERIVIGACAAVAVVLATVIFFNCISHMLEASGWAAKNSGDRAAWVQAIGSIIAIVAAALIASWQVKKSAQIQRDIRRDEGIVVALAVLTLACEYSWLTGLAVTKLMSAIDSEGAAVPRSPPELYASLDDALRAIPLHELPSAKMVQIVAGIRHHIHHTQTTIVDAWGKLSRSVVTCDEIRPEIRDIKANIFAFLDGLESEIRKMGGNPDEANTTLEARMIWQFVNL